MNILAEIPIIGLSESRFAKEDGVGGRPQKGVKGGEGDRTGSPKISLTPQSCLFAAFGFSCLPLSPPSFSLRIKLFGKEKTSCITVSVGRRVLILKNVSLSKLRVP